MDWYVILFKTSHRRNDNTRTDKRAKLLQELLGGMKVIKFFAWEEPFLKRIADYRKNEIGFASFIINNIASIRRSQI